MTHRDPALLEQLVNQWTNKALCLHFGLSWYRVGDVYEDRPEEERGRWFMSCDADESEFSAGLITAVPLCETEEAVQEAAVRVLGLRERLKARRAASARLLGEIARTARSAMDHGLPSEEGKRVSRGSCLYGSVLLVQLVRKFSSARARVCGGDGERDGGYFDRSGVGHGHYWVSAQADGRSMVLDITADQFDGQEVEVLEAEDAQGRYIEGDQDGVDEVAVELMVSLGFSEREAHNLA